MKVETRPYFLGGEQRVITVSENRKISIIPQPSGMSVHKGLYEIAVIYKHSADDTEIVGSYLTEENVERLLGSMLLQGSL